MYQIQSPISLRNTIDIDQAIQTLTKVIQNAAWNSTTCRRPSQRGAPVLPLEIRRLISEKRRARAKWQGSRYPSDQTNNRLTTAIFDYKARQYNDYTESLKNHWTVT